MSDAEAVQVLAQHYGIAATVSTLSSERDQNFKVMVDGLPRFVLKLSNAAEREDVFDFNIKVINHIAQVSPELPTPRILPTRDGGMSYVWKGRDGFARRGSLITFLPGTLLAAVDNRTHYAAALGRLTAQLGLALRDFHHPASSHQLLWDLKQAGHLLSYVDHIADADHRKLVRDALQSYVDHVRPRLGDLRAQVIHNDLNPNNILVAQDAITGVIDFGDMVHGSMINDIAVCCSYVFGPAPDPLLSIAQFVAAYHEIVPLTDAELALLPDLIATRLAITVTITSWRAAQHPENHAYIVRNQPASLYGLYVLAGLTRADVVNRLFHASNRMPP